MLQLLSYPPLTFRRIIKSLLILCQVGRQFPWKMIWHMGSLLALTKRGGMLALMLVGTFQDSKVRQCCTRNPKVSEIL